MAAVLSRHLLVRLLVAWIVIVVLGPGRGGACQGEVLRAATAEQLQFDGCVWESKGGVINLISLANTDGTPRYDFFGFFFLMIFFLFSV